MRLRVDHTTQYTFETPRKAVLQSHRLFPSTFAGQSVVTWAIDGPEDSLVGCAFRDGAGDQTATLRVRGPVEALTIHVTGVVETTDLAGVLRGHRERVPPLAYLRPTRVTRPDMAVIDLAEKAVSGLSGAPRLDHAHALAGAVPAALSYTSGSTDAATTAADALDGAEGVCQDYAHLLIAAALSQDIPARYVAGYLFAGDADIPGPEEAQTPMGPDSQASHAWAELNIEGLGWIGFDPSNECCPDARYIRLCSGYDAYDAAPIRGLSDGQGEESLKVHVAVSQEQQ
jgi:transglutaminase-like putative cysteine protease